jgi:hypothetical protein
MAMSQAELAAAWEARYGRRSGGREHKEVISYASAHGPGSTTPTPVQIAGRKADPGAVLRQTMAMDALEAQVRRLQAEDAIGAELTYLEAVLQGALLAYPPEDPTAPRPLSTAELRYRADLDADFARRQRRLMEGS